ncbi:MAG: efflux RND transporter periplasmic adaptor subunit [Candidatus Aminicenantes bacterium]|nr:efflux RND transporter periplasmic adaptor subunit [Candidatus Aminicenantes bacterium]
MKKMMPLRMFLLTGLALALLISCKPPQKAESKEKADTFGAAPVKVFKVTKQRISEKLFYTGTIEARQSINITPDVGGKIDRIYVNEGERVSKGQLLAELDTRSIRLQLEQAEAALAVAQANFNNAKTNWERMARLYKEKAVSEQQYEQVKLGYDSAAAQLSQAQAAVNLAKHSLDVSIMKAPFSGIIASKNAEVGDVINPLMGGFSPGSGGGVLTLVDFSRIKIRVEVSGSDIPLIRKGQETILQVPATPGREFRGTVQVVNLAADPQTKKFGVEVAVDNPDLVLRPGTFGQIILEVETHENALVVPQKAILENTHVFIVRDGKALRKDVMLGLQNSTLVEVLSGVEEGDSVIAEGNFGLEDGAPIEITGEVQR